MCRLQCKHHSILPKGLEHLQILVTKEGLGSNSWQTPKGLYGFRQQTEGEGPGTPGVRGWGQPTGVKACGYCNHQQGPTGTAATDELRLLSWEHHRQLSLEGVLLDGKFLETRSGPIPPHSAFSPTLGQTLLHYRNIANISSQTEVITIPFFSPCARTLGPHLRVRSEGRRHRARIPPPPPRRARIPPPRRLKPSQAEQAGLPAPSAG